MGNLRESLFKWRRGFISLLLFIVALSLASAQQRTVTGKVIDETGKALPGVNIVVQGTTTGTLTDNDGKFSIPVPGPQAVIQFSFISYNTQSVTVGAQTTLNISMVPSATALGEIVVVGYGTQKKREVTSAITSVTSDEFVKGSVNDPVQLIQGKVAGLSISKPGGDPNGTFDIRLRGMSTIGANLSPLVVIDGVVGADLNNVDPNDIQSINVLKDGSASAIYGTRGSSGVILVTTKKGKSGQAVVEYDAYVTADMVAKNVPMMTAAEWRALSKEEGLGTDFGSSTDWFKQIERTAISTVHNISMSGGTEKTSYRASINYRNNKGIEIFSGFSQLNGRINITQKALNDKFTLDLNMGATEKFSDPGFNEAFRYATIYNPTAPVMFDASNPANAANIKTYDGFFQQTLFDYYNPVSIIKENTRNRRDRITNVSLKGTYEIFKGLTLDAFYSVQNSGHLFGEYLNSHDYWGGLNRNGLATRSYDNSSSQLFESTLHYLGDITPDVNLTALAGYSYQDFVNEGFYAQGGNFITDNFTFNNLAGALDFANGRGSVTSYENSDKLIAFFGRVNLNILNAYFVSASARYEGSSRFGVNKKWGIFPALSAGADLAKLLPVSFIDNLKLRANYGITGNRPVDSYLSLPSLGTQGYFQYNGSFIPGYQPLIVANQDLKWERTGQFDVGFDFSFLNSKFTGAFDYYTKTTTDLLWYYGIPQPPNFAAHAWVNLGKLKSTGLELSINWNVVKNSDLAYTITLTPSYNLSNTLVSLSGKFNGADLTYGRQELGDMGSPGQNGTPVAVVEEGKPIGQILTYVYQGIDANGVFIFKDTNGDGTINATDRVVTGNGLPKLLLGFGNTLSFKNWDLNVFFRGVFGHDLVNNFRAFYEVPAYITSYNLPKTAANMRDPNGKLLTVTSGTLSSLYVEHGDFVTLDNMALGYNFKLPASSGFSKIRLYIAGNNLFYITKYTGVDPNPRYTDPEASNTPLITGMDRRNTWFRTRSVTFGANFVF